MTFTEIVTAVQNRLNLTSTDATTRIGVTVNDRYKRVTSSLGLNITRRVTVQSNVTIGVTTVDFTGIEKLINVVDRSVTPYRVLKEITMEELRHAQPSPNSFARFYAIAGVDYNTITIEMDCVPQAAFTLYADGDGNLSTLSGAQVPAFAESFHDIIIHGALADEYRKMEKLKLAQDSEILYERRISDLRMQIAKSSYKDIYGGKTKNRMQVSGVPGAGGGGSSVNGATSYTQTGLITFDRTSATVGSRYPFAVAVGSEHVVNLIVDDLGVLFTDITTGNVTSTKHGYAPKSPADATKFLNGAATLAYAQVKDSDLSTSDITTNDVSTSKHGFVPKAPNDATKFLNGVGAYAVPPAPTVNPATCDGRLTLETGVAVSSSDQLAKTTLYFTPYKGNLVSTYSGSAWSTTSFTEKSVAVPATTSQMYDVFIVDSTLALELVAWTNDTTRATAIVLQDGIYVKSGATTRRYLGVMRTTTVSGQTEDSMAKRFIENRQNRLSRVLRVTDTTDTWVYSTATVRQARASTANQLAMIIGVAESMLEVEVVAAASSNSASDQLWVGIGEDSTTTLKTGALATGRISVVGAGANVTVRSSLKTTPAVGYHFYAWLEWAAGAGATTWQGDNAEATLSQSGIHGRIDG